MSAEAKSFTRDGVTFFAKSTSARSRAACSMGATASAGADPNSSASAICGRILRSTGAFASVSRTRGRFRKNCSFSMESFSVRVSRNAMVSTSLFANRDEFSTSFFGLYRFPGWLPNKRW